MALYIDHIYFNIGNKREIYLKFISHMFH